MFLYIEFGSVDVARWPRSFAAMTDQVVPHELGKLLRRLRGDKALLIPFWNCSVLAECLAVADEKTLKALMTHGQLHPCPLPRPALPPPPPPAYRAGPAADGTGSAASGPENPGDNRH
jgi:hypothetical protein